MINEMIHGECLETMKTMKDDYFDSIITDVPYGISFMNKKWDYDIPSVGTFQEMLRVAKPGAFLLCFGGSRTFHRIAVNIEDAGWEIRDTLLWLYGSGFPKSYNISKGIDKKFGAEREVVGTKAGHGKSSNLSRAKQVEQGYRPEGKNYGEFDGTGLAPITKPATPEAQTWDGYGTALKPAYETIIVAMKPIDKNYVNNALTHGVSGLNIDGSRIGTEDNLNGGGYSKPSGKANKWCGDKRSSKSAGAFDHNNKAHGEFIQPKGRFPANLILDEEAAELLDEQSGILKTGKLTKEHQIKGSFAGSKNCYGSAKTGGKNNYESSQGGASRFFKKAGYEPYQNKLADLRFRYVAKASKSERNAGCEDLKKGNNHATVKPLKLMEYLCTLTKNPGGGIVLDPYAGSGTTGCACINVGRDFVGIEMDEDFVEIAKKRIEYYKKIITLERFDGNN